MIYIRDNSEPIAIPKKIEYVRTDIYQRIYHFYQNGKYKVQYEIGTVYTGK